MKLKDLLEGFVDRWKISYGDKRQIEVFKNPTPAELRSIRYKLNEKFFIKYIVFPEKETIYVFSPIEHHVTVSRKLGIGRGIEGTATRRKNGKYKLNLASEKWAKQYGFEP